MVKRGLYSLLAILSFSFLTAQKAVTIKINKEEFKSMKFLGDVIKEIPSDCEIKSYQLSLVIKESEKSSTIKGNVIESWLRDGNKITFFVEKIESGCKSKHKPKYKIVVE